MEDNWNVEVDIPDDLNEVIRRGFSAGQQAVIRRKRARRTAGRCVCSVVLAAALFVGGINISPAFAAAVQDIPVIGELVRVFGKNQPLAQGGSQVGEGTAVLTMERKGTTEQMRLEFPGADASLYQAEFASYPKTVTITLPGTGGVEILSEISRAKDTSQYIKGVCRLPLEGDSAVIQLELESDADVQIQEYRDPGSLVIRLTPAEIQLDTVYSVRTLSCDEAGLAEAVQAYAGRSFRVLRDDNGAFFLELGQYADRAEAERAAEEAGLLVEQRTGNNVPVSYRSMEDYESSRFLNEYYEMLIHADRAETVLDFMEDHFSQASSREQDEMLRGLSGFLQDQEDDETETVDWEKVASFYRLAGQPLPDFVQQNVR